MSVTVTVTVNGAAVPFEFDEQALATIAAAVVAQPRNAVDVWPAWMSVDTLARYIDASPERIRKLAARRQIPYSQEGPGCRIFFNRDDIDEWMRTNTHQ